MPRHHMKHTQNVGPNLFMRNENSAYVMLRITVHEVMPLIENDAKSISRPLFGCFEYAPYTALTIV